MAKTKDAALAELAQMGAALAEVAEDEGKRQGKFKEILDVIGTLDKDDAKQLFRDERVQRLIEAATEDIAASSDDPPGTIYGGMVGGQMVRGFTKKDGYAADLQKKVASGEVKMVRYRPVTTQPVIWQGVRRNFVARRWFWVEETFIGIYEDSLAEAERAEQMVAFLFKKSNQPPDDRGMLGEKALLVRGTGSSGHYEPGGGLISGRSEEREAAASG